MTSFSADFTLVTSNGKETHSLGRLDFPTTAPNTTSATTDVPVTTLDDRVTPYLDHGSADSSVAGTSRKKTLYMAQQFELASRNPIQDPASVLGALPTTAATSRTSRDKKYTLPSWKASRALAKSFDYTQAPPSLTDRPPKEEGVWYV
ncbi:hypothetical protein TREMEDRAFT_59094 [Tremella mesenterica DSM 1558]|uniref:uncharacterized protein n=1 Tax=Tremella mesenterica (strain ATCC 24925 / CBS 8224 / DSM 1558 / NBRC 9311 / NRRL Y-6157 / RJB 2259-6 / UBC 559-6) TaxID=578456 RepID=UPI0003F49250|nr:uncharacterized protein TREMEDRAFT_59094 [Tremella mesenterica DSM 1558]EIW72934.1 hypothetical protein TREMEDRAFT_59094 [Tremella mesenterica DSM 1558]